MLEGIRDTCLRNRVYFDEEPSLLPFASRTWVFKDVLGKDWVWKSVKPGENAAELLKSFEVLHPPFLFPRPVSQPDEPALLYPFLPGKPLAGDSFDDPALIERVMDTLGRLQAAMRSLSLVPHYQETLRLKNTDNVSLDDLFGGRSMDHLQNLNDRQRAARQMEMEESYHWTNKRASETSRTLVSAGLWSAAAVDTFLDRLKNYFPLHVPVMGSNLCHCAAHPEHLLLCGEDALGLVGWQVAPRPRFYMQHTYLCWSLLHSKRPDAVEFHQDRLKQMSSRAFLTEHHLVFLFCLVEQLADFLEAGNQTLGLPESRVKACTRLLDDCLEKAGKPS